MTADVLRDIESVRRLVRIARAEHPGRTPAAWGEALNALDALEARYRHADESPLWRGRLSGGASAANYVAMVGIDRFSGLREELGEAVIEAVNAELCARIAADLDARFGRFNRSTIEFNFTAGSEAEAHAALRRLQLALEQPIGVDQRNLCLDVTIGFAARPPGGDIEGVVDRAEQALAKARSGHQKVQAFTEADEAARAGRLALMRDLRHAPERGELFLVHQPKLDLKTLSVTSVEALVRWRHPRLGLVAPDAFIGLAEESGEIRQLTAFVLRQAIADRAALAASGASLLINVNISGELLADDAFADFALSMAAEAGEGLGFEITETAVIANPEKALAHIKAFVDSGVKIAIDDYGSGLSSLSYLKQIPAHELKIDKAFVSGLTQSHRDPLLVRSTIDLAHALDMQVTAEGVDSNQSLALLRVMGCDMVQGYHVSKPLDREALSAFLGSFSPDVFAPKPLFAPR